MEQTECSETSACKIQTPGNYPEKKTHTTFSTRRKFEIKAILSFVATGIITVPARKRITVFRPSARYFSDWISIEVLNQYSGFLRWARSKCMICNFGWRQSYFLYFTSDLWWRIAEYFNNEYRFYRHVFPISRALLLYCLKMCNLCSWQSLHYPLKARIKSHLLFAGIIRSAPFSPR